MASLGQGLRLGAGLAGIGWGLYSMARGQRNWLAAVAVTTGASMVLNELGESASEPVRRRLHRFGSFFMKGRYSRVGEMAYQLAPPWAKTAADLTEEVVTT